MLPDSNTTVITELKNGFSLVNTIITIIISLATFIITRIDSGRKTKKSKVDEFIVELDKTMDSMEEFMKEYLKNFNNDQGNRPKREFVIGRADCLRVHLSKFSPKIADLVDGFILQISDLTYEKDSEKISRQIQRAFVTKNLITAELKK